MKSPVGVGLDGVRLDRRLLPHGTIPFRLPDLRRESGPNAAVLRLIHRTPDGFVALATKSHGDWRELGAVHVADLLGFNAWSQVHRDAYFG
jgi:hypothetical protein